MASEGPIEIRRNSWRRTGAVSRTVKGGEPYLIDVITQPR